MIRPLLIAVQFLTQLPVRLNFDLDEKDVGRSLIYYPLVGLLIGTLLVVLAFILNSAPTLLSAAIVLTFWVALTGGLHLDGLADSADAWVGGLGDREKTLAIMKDPRCGAAGVVSIVLLLLMKFAALQAIIEADQLLVLLFSPLLGRTALPLLFMTTPYVREQGLGWILATYLPRRALIYVMIIVAISTLFLAGNNSLWLILMAMFIFALLRNMAIRRLGGMSGDVAGALLEIIETTVLVAAILLL